MKLRKPKIDLVEIHQYVQDLERITMLRDKSKETKEVIRYNTILEVMQKVMVRLNEL